VGSLHVVWRLLKHLLGTHTALAGVHAYEFSCRKNDQNRSGRPGVLMVPVNLRQPASAWADFRGVLSPAVLSLVIKVQLSQLVSAWADKRGVKCSLGRTAAHWRKTDLEHTSLLAMQPFLDCCCLGPVSC